MHYKKCFTNYSNKCTFFPEILLNLPTKKVYSYYALGAYGGCLLWIEQQNVKFRGQHKREKL